MNMSSIMQIATPTYVFLASSCTCSVVSMLKSKDCGGEGKFKLIEHFARRPRLKVITLCCSQCSPAAMSECYMHTCRQLTRIGYLVYSTYNGMHVSGICTYIRVQLTLY